MALSTVALLATACGGAAEDTGSGVTTAPTTGPVSEAPSAAASEQPPAKVSYRNVCEPANDGRVITTTGYLGLGVVARRDGDLTTGEPYWHVELARKPGGNGDVSVFLYEGDEPNQMAPVPEQYRPDDLKVKATNGRTVGPDDRVRVTGEASVADGVCYIDDVRRIRNL
ncbi:MAG TPA: hypothetical protein VK891_01050 [Euzebyales bacterium]|nr:hypothetical protein [Euzebyales bacterium]